MRFNWLIQGSCAELLWEALRYLATKKDRVIILPHFNDELVLKCIVCPSHNKEVCDNILKIRNELEDLYPFVWPGTDTKVFKLDKKGRK